MSELGVKPNYDYGPRRGRNGREKLDFKELSFLTHEPLRNSKKTIQAFESLNYDVRARS